MNRDHAVVIGGSLTGLLAARILSGHFDRVTPVERDRFPAGAAFRPGVPQSHHLHVLWTRGLSLLEELFPGLEKTLLTAGAVEIGVPSDVLWLTAAGWRTRFEVTRLLTFSRPLLDWAVRSRLAGDVPSLDVLEGHEVVDLVPRGRDVAGVVLRSGEAVTADLVVDATGRGSRAPAWLEALGYPAPPETLVDPLLGYASRFYAIPDGFDPGWKALYLQADPPETRRTGGLFPQEGGRWICSLSGAGGDYGPTGEEEFLAFAKGLRDPVLYEAIRDAEPLSPIRGFRRTANHRRHYERLPAWPRGFVVMGDAACAFNPIYGQGMSVAAISAVALDRCLREDRDDLERRFQKHASRSAAGAWLVATGEDLRYRETEAAPTRMSTRLINAYVDRVVAAANVDRRVCASLLDVIALTSAPASLFSPGVLARVTANAVRPTPSPALPPTAGTPPVRRPGRPEGGNGGDGRIPAGR
jgi:2-polyprenyl-6-methoxyphenol hydroxylase-like FAD-dependent oxidoreductase